MWAKVIQLLLGSKQRPHDQRIGIRTRRPSAVICRLLMEPGVGIEVRIDRKRYGASDLPWLTESWCTNSNIRKVKDFEIRHEGRTICGFHDSIDELLIDESKRELVNALLREKLVRIDTKRSPRIGRK